MQFLRTLFWVVVAVALLIFAVQHLQMLQNHSRVFWQSVTALF